MADDTLPVQSGILDPLIGAGFFTPNMSLEEIKRRRAIGAALASRARPFPKTIGEGLTYFGEALAEGRAERQLAEAEKGYNERFAKEAGPLRERIGADNTVLPVVAPAPVATPSPAPPAPVGPTAAVNPLTVEPTSGPASRTAIYQALARRNGAVPPGPTVTAGSPPPTLPPAGGPFVSRNASLDDGVTVSDDEGNPPTISRDIKPMVMAQARTGAPPAAPVQPTATPGGTLAPIIPEALPDRPQPVRDENMTKTEKDAWLFWQRTQDPRAKDMFDQAHALGKAARDAKYTREKTDYDKYVAQQIAREALRERARIDAPKTQLELQEQAAKSTAAQAGEQARLFHGSLPEPVQKTLEASKEKAATSVAAMEAARDARQALPDAVFGLGADYKLLGYRAAAAAGNKDAQRVVEASQTFQSNMGPLIQQLVKGLAGKDVSKQELEFIRSIAGGNLALDRTSADRILKIAERTSGINLRDHQETLDIMLKGQPETALPSLRKQYGVREPGEAVPLVSTGREVPPAPTTVAPTGPPRTFASEAEAEAAGLPKGTPVIINGRRGRIN